MTRAKFMTACAGIVGAAAVLTVGADVGNQSAEATTQAYCVKGSYGKCWGQYWGGWKGAYVDSSSGGQMYSIE